LAFFEDTRIIVAWCELREDFRHFRTDRIHQLTLSETRFTKRQALLKQWRIIHNIPQQ
jgi:predicted DNA-binding transcriptional regulator YafY